MYHRGPHSPHGATPRVYGPLYRFDVHTPPPHAPATDPLGRNVVYVGADLATSAAEVFGETGEAALCPNYRVALLRPTRPLRMFDLTAPGSALAIGALPSLADGPYPRTLTQQWARAIYEDDPTGTHPDGIRYRSAYNFGAALAVWGTSTTRLVEQVVGADGVPSDFALRLPVLYARLVSAMNARRITVRLVEAADCPLCP